MKHAFIKRKITKDKEGDRGRECSFFILKISFKSFVLLEISFLKNPVNQKLYCDT